MQVHVQIDSLPKIEIFLLNLRLVLWYYLIKASTFKICFVTSSKMCVTTIRT